MKTLLLSCLATAAFLALSACTTVEDREPSVSTTTTTEESTVRRPSVSATTETRTMRAY